MKTPRDERPTTYWIDRPEQIRALASPLRHEIGDRLAAQGAMTVADLARALGRRPTAIYHHLKKLESVGLIRAREETGERGRPAVLYETVAPRMRLARAGRHAKNRRPLARAGAAAAAQASRDYAAGFQAPHWTLEGPGRNHWFFRVVASPSPTRLKRMNELLTELAELVWEPDPKPGPSVSIAWFLSPLGRNVKRKPR
ncbi:MAG TPA: helix-turn-helix domain-containing protein [Candidatus Eisenbacteria bacterium]|nr:helix-turn-helix domain-containing protein [Candidatus Eisenbacteria bacterium]